MDMPSYTVDPPFNIHFIVFSSVMFSFSVPKSVLTVLKSFRLKFSQINVLNQLLSTETQIGDFTVVVNVFMNCVFHTVLNCAIFPLIQCFIVFYFFDIYAHFRFYHIVPSP